MIQITGEGAKMIELSYWNCCQCCCLRTSDEISQTKVLFGM